MGMSVWARREGARPSQKKVDFQARLKRGMELRLGCLPSTPGLKRRGSVKAEVL